ncbi:uncharacterized protein CG3556-like [Antedon mediterranea]|uniref:uncharacterized protein CG3556-like n=1 Tax=Antedon mediterranea TaxID=105859 RepID=UPI003AF62A9A
MHSVQAVVFLIATFATAIALDVSQICGESTPTELVEQLENSIERASTWLEDQQLLDGSWPLQSTKEAIWALQTTNEDWYSLEATTRQLGVKQLEIELLAELAHNNKANHIWPGRVRNRKLSLGKFSYYTHALNATCHDVTDFYGHDLPAMLQAQMHLFPREGFNNYYQYALAMLAVCNSGQMIKVRNVRILIGGQDEDGEISFHSRLPDETAMAVMALQCVFRSVNHNIKTMVSQAIQQAELALLEWQLDDGSFGNPHSTALVVQALMTSKEHKPETWRCTDAVQSILDVQKKSGSFGNLGATLHILPALAGRHYGELKYLNPSCKKNPIRMLPRLPTNSSSIMLYLTIQDEVQVDSEATTLVLAAPHNASLFEIMQLAHQSDQDEFRFEFGESSWGHFVTSINGLKSNGDKNHYWMLLNSSGELTSTGMDDIYPEHGEQYVWTYRALG